MENVENKLHVENLTISFHTDAGKVQAVRGINFDLNQGETLAIVGESGSGKSVTSKAILGILAGNSIIEAGEIIYDGQDLLKISEEDFHKIRGDKIAMIFQDPMSSLNPIVKIGKQLTEAMILKGAARQKESKTLFNSYLKSLNETMVRASAQGDEAKAKELSEKCAKFDKFEYKHLELETAYNRAHEAAVEACEDIDVLTFEISKNAADDLNYRMKHMLQLCGESVEKYVVNSRAEELKSLIDEIKSELSVYKKTKESGTLIEKMNAARDIMQEAVAFDEPNFFSLGFFETFSKDPLPEMSVAEMNTYTRSYLDNEFMLDFIGSAKEALVFSANEVNENRKAALALFEEKKSYFTEGEMDSKSAKAVCEELEKAVAASIDPLAIKKDSTLYTFMSGFESALDKYFKDIVNNEKERKRFAKETEKREKLIAKGKNVDWKVVPAFQINLDAARENLGHMIDRLTGHLKDLIAALPGRNFNDETVSVIDYLKACASGVVKKVTKRMAKDKALKLMEEVGIAEPRRRYDQYPFEFSGGMRQRIVIAIALAADPDILICDEPTTALDVTIQSQILELINKLKAERNLSVIFITHDLGVVANMADRIAVMYAGKIVEYGTADDIFYRSAHPYTWALLSSMPDLDTNEKLEAIPGTPPNMIYPPVGDAFAARNKYALQIDFEAQPPMFQITDTHYAATWLLHPNAPKIDPPKAILDRIERMKKKWEAQENDQ